MTKLSPNRRTLIAGAAVTLAAPALIRPARAEGLAPTPTMRGGANNYRPGAALTDRIGGGGFLMTGSVRRAGDGAPIESARIQMWAHTTEGHERDPHSHGATVGVLRTGTKDGLVFIATDSQFFAFQAGNGNAIVGCHKVTPRSENYDVALLNWSHSDC